MPKKRFNTRYSKPASTSHPSLVSAVPTPASNRTHRQVTVNELIDSLRRSDLASIKASSSIINTPTLHPDLRRLLAEPEIPPPRPRSRDYRHLNTNLRSIAAGPAAPRSWVSEQLQCHPCLQKCEKIEHIRPFDINHLPGIYGVPSSSLRENCLKQIARNWNFLQVYEKHHLANIPSRLRSTLLSYLTVFGPESGVGFSGLKNIIVFPKSNIDECSARYIHNENFSRLDLSGAIGSSLSIEQVTGLVRYKSLPTSVETSILSWEDNLNLSISLIPPIPHLTHLSLSHPSLSVSWSALLSLTAYLPTLTHLSLAHWPIPLPTQISVSNVSNQLLNEIYKFSNTKKVSQILDDYYSNATRTLRKLANHLPGLKYLDLTGCQAWFKVLVAYDIEDLYRGIEWGKHWTQLQTLKLQSGLEVTKDSEEWKIKHRLQAYECALEVENKILSLLRQSKTRGMNFTWIQIVKDT
ncbi:putative tafazzin [Erysiphe neolycopersici]|uniref:Putative tafazzin n=1 Tax=Erysiphe neolycopersici TaxID=212602 RepID=A0A420HV02_9PEZI|nr:putative tafazzin [Erysiphe neolycopersici]